jgi:hypothetical protein
MLRDWKRQCHVRRMIERGLGRKGKGKKVMFESVDGIHEPKEKSG